MKVEHIAVWVDDIELMKEFYLKYFDVCCNNKYVNPTKNYTSYFLTFNEGGARIELMNRPDIEENDHLRYMLKGLAHICISIGGKDAVNDLTERFRKDGYTIASEPRTSGDGYYESAVLDPEGNYIELLAER
ncbi:VOC family protein [Bacteroides sp. 224]|uniref:VOC family protein n=1 Tax=Bacteroides sp. 224 TaxID=2302936 RepID=UPI0013D4A187|nr:VOC family protein [Bacteroides sp. 224]NDV66662.1 glyoxalase/bleomycin resistance/extradiol dioxygenase family protein [Bacteroides sp. 224]